MAPVPTTLRYRRLVSVGLANQAINLSTAKAMGHRVLFDMSAESANAFFYWTRLSGSARAVGHFSATAADASGNTMEDVLVANLGESFTDVDADGDRLNFNSAVLDSNSDPRLRKDGVSSANDLVMAYILFKAYGSSTYVTSDVVYNLEDAQNMVTNEEVAGAIVTSLTAEDVSGVGYYIDNMFTSLLASDPMRFFDASGKQVVGLFETNADADASGSWMLVANDKIEIPIEFEFTAPVTTSSVIDNSGELSGNTNKTTVIETGDKFQLRLQINITA
jgi:hypothetical protein